MKSTRTGIKLAAVATLLLAAATTHGAKLCIDPGHGGSDPGAVGNGLRECDMNLDMSLRARDLFNA
ncbi:MAG: N-acetylmuramoyl-L-alanine amidase, partial [Phycisphaerae bacterium]|nr:N-acetylmuramoyl-L-alanine amidase [Phycisphaerae bacterium]